MEKLDTIRKIINDIHSGRDTQYTKQQREDAMFYTYGAIEALRAAMKTHMKAVDHYDHVNSGDPKEVRDEAMKCLELEIRKMPDAGKLAEMERTQVGSISSRVQSYRDIQEMLRSMPEEGESTGREPCPVYEDKRDRKWDTTWGYNIPTWDKNGRLVIK